MATSVNTSKLQRSWVTPLVAGSFFLMAVTGILMFFHWDTGLNKVVHEWLGWAMVIAVVLHVLVNFQGFKNMFRTTMGKGILGLFSLILVLSFFNLSGNSDGGKPPFMSSVNVLSNASITELSQVSHIDEQTLLNRLQQSGVTSATSQSTVKQLVGDDVGKQMRTLNAILKTAP